MRTKLSFTLFVHGADVLSDESTDALYEAGCDDATFGVRDSAPYGAFDREGPASVRRWRPQSTT